MKKSLKVFRIGARGSKLSLAQAGEAMDMMRGVLPLLDFKVVSYATPGDRDMNMDLRDSPADFFTRDLDQALVCETIDCAIHSAKDLPQSTPRAVDWFWLPATADPRDVIVLRPGEKAADLPKDARVGISSERRKDYCCRQYPRLQSVSIRGTIEERLQKLDAGEYDMLIVAAAGLQRLGLEQRISGWIPVEELTPPDGQGRLAVTFRTGDFRFLRLRSLFIKPALFVGAGPGAEELCTVGGCAALKACDVCLYDCLVDIPLLDFLNNTAQQICVGKRCGQHEMEQEEMLMLLATHIRRGCRVVRLKGGDPGIFGHLAEEIEFLDSLQLPYRVIPGVSSLNAATTGTGMLLTRRGLSRGFSVVTPRGAKGKHVCMTAVERKELPLALFMAAGVLREVVTELLDRGYAKSLPAAMVIDAGLESQMIVHDSLGKIGKRSAKTAKRQASLLIVGEIASARFLYHAEWSALKGMRVLVTCSAALQEKTAGVVTDYGGVPVRMPLIRLVPEEGARETLGGIQNYDWVILTSPSAVKCFVSLLDGMGMDWRRLPKIMVSGPATAAELSRYRLRAVVEAQDEFGSEGLLNAAKGCLSAGKSVLLCRSDAAADTILSALKKYGVLVRDCVLYRNIAVKYERKPEFDAVFFASGSAVRAFISNWDCASLVGKKSVAIGKKTALMMKRCGCEPGIIAPQATAVSSIGALAADCVAQDLLNNGKQKQHARRRKRK